MRSTASAIGHHKCGATNVLRNVLDGGENGYFHKPSTETRSATISFDDAFRKKTVEYGLE